MAGDEEKSAAIAPPQNGPRRKRPDAIADRIRELIVEHELKPGDRLPPAWLEESALRASRGTLREAMKILEFQGLLTHKTGPGGGAFVSTATSRQAIGLIDNLFLFDPPSIGDVYAIRKLVEPEIAAGAANSLSEEALDALQATIRLYEDEPKTAEEEYAQRLAELDFHVVLASYCDNKLLGFISTFVLSLLRDKTECRAIYREPNPSLREAGLNYQVKLLRALKAGSADRARTIMLDHMIEAEQYMLERATLRTVG